MAKSDVLAMVYGKQVGTVTTPAGHALNVYRSSSGRRTYINPDDTGASVTCVPPIASYRVHIGVFERMVNGSEHDALTMFDDLYARRVQLHERLANARIQAAL